MNACRRGQQGLLGRGIWCQRSGRRARYCFSRRPCLESSCAYCFVVPGPTSHRIIRPEPPLPAPADCTATCTRPGFKCNAANLCIPYVPPPTTGDDCSNGPADICKVQCLNGGTCLPPDSCDCTGTGYSGPTCNIRNCTGFAVNAGADQTVTTGTVNITVAVTPAAFTPADISFTFTPATAGAACVAAAGAPGVYTCSGLPNGKTTINVTATKDGEQRSPARLTTSSRDTSSASHSPTGPSRAGAPGASALIACVLQLIRPHPSSQVTNQGPAFPSDPPARLPVYHTRCAQCA